jgi:hypothetical protein
MQLNLSNETGLLLDIISSLTEADKIFWNMIFRKLRLKPGKKCIHFSTSELSMFLDNLIYINEEDLIEDLCNLDKISIIDWINNNYYSDRELYPEIFLESTQVLDENRGVKICLSKKAMQWYYIISN